jgi:hypothetical protein
LGAGVRLFAGGRIEGLFIDMSNMMEIAKWNETFENADTRKRQRLGWLFIPTGCDSNGYLSLVAQDGGFEAFGIFLAICQWSATQPRELRGKLARTNGSPLTEKDIAVRIRAEVCQVSAALNLLTSNDVGWIVEDDSEKSASHLPLICQSSPDFVQGEGQGEGQEQGEGEAEGRAPADLLESEKLSGEGKYIEALAARIGSTPEELTKSIEPLKLPAGCLDAYLRSRASEEWRTKRGRSIGFSNWLPDLEIFASHFARYGGGDSTPAASKAKHQLPANWREIAQEIYGHPVTCSEDDLTADQRADIYRQARA